MFCVSCALQKPAVVELYWVAQNVITPDRLAAFYGGGECNHKQPTEKKSSSTFILLWNNFINCGGLCNCLSFILYLGKLMEVVCWYLPRAGIILGKQKSLCGSKAGSWLSWAWPDVGIWADGFLEGLEADCTLVCSTVPMFSSWIEVKLWLVLKLSADMTSE